MSQGPQTTQPSRKISQSDRKVASTTVRVNGDKVRSLRKELKLTQQELADAARLAKKTIENVEKGEPVYYGTLALLANALHIDASLLEATDDVRLLVLPFKNHSREPEPFVDGMTSSVISWLGLPKKLSVRSQYTSLTFKGVNTPLKSIARELGVDRILDGTVSSKSDTIVVVNLTLVDGLKDRVVWTKAYEAERHRILSVLASEVVSDVAGALGLETTKEEKGQMSSTHVVDPEAHIAYFTGRHYWSRPTEDALHKAIGYFQEAATRDPSWALPYSGLADSYTLLGMGDFLAGTQAMAVAEESAKRALTRDFRSAEGHTSLAAVKAYFQWDWQEAEKSVRTAIQLNPRYQTAHHVYAMACLLPQGRFDEAIDQMSVAEYHDPLSFFVATCVGITCYYARRWEDAIKHLNRALELQPNYYLALWHLGWVFQARGDSERGLELIQQATSEAHRSPQMLAVLSHACALAGKADEALTISAELNECANRRFVSFHELALACLGQHDFNRTIELLEKAADQRAPAMTRIAVHPLFDPLRRDERFINIGRKMGLL